jgi:hypothetical protein
MPEDMDRFDSSSYNVDNIEFEEEGIMATLRPGIDLLKKKGKLIIAVIVLLIIAYVAFDFFIGSVREVTVVIQDPEGDPISNNRFKLYDSAGEKLESEEGNDRYVFQLRGGEYRYTVDAPQYKTQKSTFTVSDSGREEIVLEKNWDVEIVDFEDSFPGQWIAGQKRMVEFLVKNDDSVARNVSLLFEDDIKNWSSTREVTIPANSTQTVAFEVSIPRDIDFDKKEKKSGKELTAKARIEETKEEQEKNFKLFSAPDIDFKISSFPKGMDAGEVNTKAKVKIENDSDFPIENITITIEVPERTQNWFQFQEKSGEPEPWTITIPRIDADSDVTKTVRVDVAPTAKIETITGKVVLSASFIQNSLEETFNLEIEDTANFGLELSTKDTVKIDWVPEDRDFEEIIEAVKVKNIGDVALEGIRITVKNSLVCSTDWIELVQESVPLLEAKDNYEINMVISAPIAQRGNESRMLCKLGYRYYNPLAGNPGQPDFKEGELEGEIAVEPQPD